MSVQIQREKCVGCGRCVEVCPGNLIKIGEQGKAGLLHPEDCWGCTSCLKECKMGAVQFFLGADIGGRGSLLSVQEHGEQRIWQVTEPSGEIKTIEINRKDANKY